MSVRGEKLLMKERNKDIQRSKRETENRRERKRVGMVTFHGIARREKDTIR